MSLYIDTSCLLKLIFVEPESQRVAEIVAKEKRVIVSSLSMAEASTRFHRLRQERIVPPSVIKQLQARFRQMLAAPPFEHVEFQSDFFVVAVAQSRPARAPYCKTLDRLHLAAAATLGLKRFLTNDNVQARAVSATQSIVVLNRRKERERR